MPLTKDGLLTKCDISTNCVLVEWKFKNLNESYQKLIEAASSLPRTQVIEQSANYWHGVCRSLMFRFPDDLEINKLPKQNIIQVRSASRIGLSDLGVNEKRVKNLYNLITQST